MAKATKTDESQDAAVKEVEDSGPRTITVRGTEFALPPKQPFAIIYAARRANRAERTGDEVGTIEAILDMLEAYVGEEPLRRFTRDLDAEEGSKAIKELLDACNAEYGTDTGESSASQDS